MKKLILLLISLSLHANLENIFTDIYLHNKWKSKESFSGATSTLRFTKHLRSQLPDLLNEFSINSIFDAACGDFNWMKEISLANRTYIGADIVKALVARNQSLYEAENVHFIHADITKDSIPRADLIIFRFTCTNLAWEETLQAIRNFKNSGSTYLLITTYPQLKQNIPIKAGANDYKINLERPPFNFPKPLAVIEERKKRKENTLVMGLWKLDDVLVTHIT